MTTVALPPHGLNAADQERCRHWIKRLTGVNTQLTNGHTFEGEFLQFGDTVDAPEGTLFLSYIENRRSSGRVDGRRVVLYQAGSTGLHVVKGWDLDGSVGWALQIRIEIAQLITASASLDTFAWMIDIDSGRRKDAKVFTIDGRPVTWHADNIEETQRMLEAAGVIARGRRAGHTAPTIILLFDEGAAIDWHDSTRLTGRDVEVADEHGYADRWDRFDAVHTNAQQLADVTQPMVEVPVVPEPHHGDVCPGVPVFGQDSVEQWSAECSLGAVCEYRGLGNGTWEVTGCETLREAGARFFGGDDPALYGA